jgi:hypothetical protein
MNRLHRRILQTFTWCCLAALLSGCDGLLSTSNRRPDIARVVVTGTSNVPLRLITSTNFTAAPNFETGAYDVTFGSYDSDDLELPIERTVQLNTDRFIARLVHLSEDEADAADVVMEVYLDGALAYRQQAIMVDSFLDSIHVF